MGIFNADIEIGSPEGSRFATVNALVGTGASLTAVPASLLRCLGVMPHDRETFILADGREIERDIGQTWIQVGDRSAITLVMFGDEDMAPRLGIYSLHGLLLTVDAPNQRLIPARLRTRIRRKGV